MKNRSKSVMDSKFLIALSFLVMGLRGYSQVDSLINENPQEQKVVIMARATGKEILLRWGVNDKNLWKLANEYGFVIERVLLEENGNTTVSPEEIILSGGAIRPRPLNEWQSLVEQNDMAGVVAQAIYGEDFETTTNSNQNTDKVSQIINQSSELQQRFAFSMFAIDQDFEVAQYAGLGFVDRNVRSNARYLYNIKLATPENISVPNPTGLIVSTANPTSLPKPYDFAGYYYNDAFVLIWEYDALRHFYNAYDLEKSVDGINFEKLNQTPITKIMDSKSSGIAFTDSIESYSQKYWYRIKGKTIFGETSQPSDTISIIAYKELLVAPELKENEILSEKEAILKWDFNKSESWKLTGFDILRADQAIGPYQSIKENLAPETRSYLHTELQEINYFKVRAKGIAGDHIDSSPNMIQPIDSIPPVQPTGLSGKIDSTGVVHLTWEPNKELDLRGYTIFRADRPNQEFTRLNKNQTKATKFTDSINLKTFNKNVYYKIDAVDNRYNSSKVSEILTLRRPDQAPPTNAVITGYELQNDGVELNWLNSNSDDVVEHIIYRNTGLQSTTSNNWEEIFKTSNKEVTRYLDKNIADNTKYSYTIIARDSSGLESPPSPPISLISLGKQVREGLANFSATVNREDQFIQLTWRLRDKNITEIQLFKKENESPFSLFRTFAEPRSRFLDNELLANSTYSYGIKVVYNDGSISKWQETSVVY